MTKSELFDKWQKIANANTSIEIGTAEYSYLNIEPFLDLFGVKFLEIAQPVVSLKGANGILLQGNCVNEQVQSTVFRLLVLFAPDRIVIAVTTETKVITFDWLLQHNMASLPGALLELQQSVINHVTINYSSLDKKFLYKVAFADVELDLFKAYHFSFSRPLLTAVIENGKCHSVSVIVETEFIGKKLDFKFTVPFSTDQYWILELCDETGLDIKFADVITQLGTITARADLSEQVPQIVAGQMPSVSIELLRLKCPYDLKGQVTFDISVRSFDKFELIPNLELLFPGFSINGAYMAGKLMVSCSLSGVFYMGRGARLGISAYVGNDLSVPWDFHIEGEVDVKHFSLFENLPFGIKLPSLSLPENLLSLNTITLERFDLSIDAAEKKILGYEFDLHADCKLEVIKGIGLANPSLSIFYEPSDSIYEAFNGSFSGDLKIGKTTFFGTAKKNSNNWTLSAGTGVTEPFLLRQFVADLSEITGTTLPIEIIPDIKVGYTGLEYQTESKSFYFTSTLEVPIPLPFLAHQSIVLGSYIDLHLEKADDKYDISFHFSARVEIGQAVLAVAFSKEEGKSEFAGGWKAVDGEGALTLEKIANIIELKLPVSGLPAILNPQFSEIAFSYTEADATFALSAHTTNGSDYFFVARKNAEADWNYVLGLDYDDKTTDASEDVAELIKAASDAKLSKVHILYASTDLVDFRLPHVPDVGGKSSSQLQSGKLLNVKKGVFAAAEANNISLPKIGKLQPEIKQFYISVEKQNQIVVLVKGSMDFKAGDQVVNITLQAEYASGAKELTFNGKITANTGLVSLLGVLVDDGQLQLPEDVLWPDISEAQLTFSTAEGSVAGSITTVPGKSTLAVAGLFSVGANQVNVRLSKTKGDIEIIGGHLKLDVLDPVFPEGIGGTLTLHLEKENNRFVFDPSGFTITTPEITYTECEDIKQAGGKTGTQTISRKLCAKITPGAFSFIQLNKQWTIAAEATLVLQDLPDPVRRIFMEEQGGKWVSKPIKLAAGLKDGALFFGATGTLLELEIPDLMAEMGVKGLPQFGKSAIRLLGAMFYIGKDIALDLEFGYALPMRLNEVLGMEKVKLFKTLASPPGEQFTRFSIRISSSDITGKIIDSPFYLLNGITEDGDKVHIDLDLVLNDKDLGRITFKKPVIQLDADKGTFKFKGGYEIDPQRPVAIPLKLLRKLFEAIGLNQIADKVPKSIPVKSMKLEETLQWLIDMLNHCGITLPDGLRDILLAVQKIESSFSSRFRSYLSLSIPQSLDASIDVTADGGVGFSLTTTGDPLQFLLPTPLAFIGLRLTHVSLGTAMGGSLLKFECSAELDTFDYAELLLSTTLYELPEIARKLPARNELQHTFAVEELLMLIVYETGIPIPIPLFYQSMAFKFKGIEGLDIHTDISFPQPKFNVMKALKIVSDLKRLFSEKKDLEVVYPLTIQKDADEPAMNLVFDAGPFYMRLPKYIATGDDGGGRLFGWTAKYRLLDLLNLAGVLLNGINHFIKERTPAYLVQALPLALRYNDIKIMPLENLEASVAWLMATPQEVVKLYNDHQLPGAALEELVPLLNLLTFKPSTDTGVEAVKAPENAVLFFMQGKLQVGAVAEAKLSAALCWLPDGLASSMLIHVAAPNDILLIHLDGRQAITPTSFQVAGSASLKLLGFEIFRGTFIAASGLLFLEASAFNNPALPIGFYGKIHGQFANDKVKLEGVACFKFFFLKADMGIDLHLEGSEAYFAAAAAIDAGEIFSGSFKFRSLLTQNASYDASVNFDLKVFSVFSMVSVLNVHIDPADIQFRGDVDFRFLNNSFLKAGLGYKDGTLSVTTDFSILDILKIHGTISVREDYFHLTGSLQFDLAGITAEGSIDVLKDRSGESFNLMIGKLFGSENQLTFTLARAADTLQLISLNKKPISVFNGTLIMAGDESMQTGPLFKMNFDHIGMQCLVTKAHLKAFGLASASVDVAYANATGSFSATFAAAIHTEMFNSDTLFNLVYNTNLFKLTGYVKLDVDLNEALASVFYHFFNVQLPGSKFVVGLEMTDFEFSVEQTSSPLPPDVSEYEKRIAEVNKRIAEVNALSQKALDGLDALFLETDQTVNEINAMMGQDLTTAQRELLTKWQTKLPKNKADIEPFIKGHKTTLKDMEKLRLDLSDASYKVRDFDYNWKRMFERFESVDNITKGFGYDWSEDGKRMIMSNYEVSNTVDFMSDVLQDCSYDEAYAIHDNYYVKNTSGWPHKSSAAADWLSIKHVDIETRKDKGYQWRNGNYESINNAIKAKEDSVTKYIKFYDTAAIPIIKSDLLQSHIDLKLIITSKKSNELAKHELPLTAGLPDAANANEVGMRVVFRAKVNARIPGLGNISLGDVHIHWAGISDLDNNSTLWQHLQRAFNAYMSQQLVRIINDQYSSIWDIVACLKRMITGGNALSNNGEIDLDNLVAGFAQISPEVSKSMKNIIDNPPPLNV